MSPRKGMRRERLRPQIQRLHFEIIKAVADGPQRRLIELSVGQNGSRALDGPVVSVKAMTGRLRSSQIRPVSS